MKNIVLFMLVVYVMSCANAQQLTRTQAKKQIIEKLGYPQDELHDLVVQDNSIYRYMFAKRWEKYAKLGLLTINEYKGGVSAILTQKGELYRREGNTAFGGSILLKEAELHFVEITGIRTVDYGELGGDLHASVEYTIERRNITPFGEANNLEEEIIEKKATFIKYDDGWRIQKKR